jgi:hypothetical protein
MLLATDNHLPLETKRTRWQGVELMLVYSPAITGRRGPDNKPFIEDDSWYWACATCGNCGKHSKDGAAIIAGAIAHAEYDHSEYGGAA